MAIKEKKVCTCTCNKCGYEWQTRTERIPKACPNCKSMRWDATYRTASERPTSHPEAGTHN